MSDSPADESERPTVNGDLTMTILLLILLVAAILFIANLIGAIHVFG